LDIVMGFLPELAVAYILAKGNLRNRTFVNLLLVLIAVVILLASMIGSRSVLFSIIGSVLCVTVFIPVCKSVLTRFKIIAVLAVSVLLALAVIPENSKSFYNNWQLANSMEVLEGDIYHLDSDVEAIDYGDIDQTDSAAIRIFLWKDAIGKIMDKPLLGQGVRQWRYTYPHPHNVILESGVMFGLPALVALMIFILYTMWNLRSISQNQERRVLPVLVGGLFLYLLFYNLVQGQLASFRSLPLFIIFGLATAVLDGNAHGSILSRRE